MQKTPSSRTPRADAQRAFTLVELLVVIAVIAILAVTLLPVLAGSGLDAQRISCMNNLRQLGLAFRLYANSHAGHYPPRNDYPKPKWPAAMYPYYGDTNLLVCPAEKALYGPQLPPNNGGGTGYTNWQADRAPLSYLMNGWNDLFGIVDWSNPSVNQATESMIKPAVTIVIGERRHSDQGDFWMDFYENENGGINNLIYSVQHGRHGYPRPNTSGGSNYLFGDGSVRYLKFGLDVYPVNQWVTGDTHRVLYAISFRTLTLNVPND